MCGCGGHGMGHMGHGHGRHDETEHTPMSKDDPLDILKVRLAKGEITAEEFREMREILQSH